MKFFVYLCLLASIAYPCVESKGFRFADFFFGGAQESPDSEKRSPPTDISPESNGSANTNASIRLQVEDEMDRSAENSSLYDEFIGLDPWNSSESNDGIQSSLLLGFGGEINATTRQSVKKELSSVATPSSTMSSPTPKIEQENFKGVGSASDSSATSISGLNVTSNTTDEMEEVVLGTTKTLAIPNEKTVFQKSIEWVEDAYTLSILIPVAGGVLFATTCIITIAICGCLRRCCRRRRLRRKVLPDSVKNLRASDRARLLGDCSSDEEF